MKEPDFTTTTGPEAVAVGMASAPTLTSGKPEKSTKPEI